MATALLSLKLLANLSVLTADILASSFPVCTIAPAIAEDWLDFVTDVCSELLAKEEVLLSLFDLDVVCSLDVEAMCESSPIIMLDFSLDSNLCFDDFEVEL